MCEALPLLSSPASGGGGPAKPVEGARLPPNRLRPSLMLGRSDLKSLHWSDFAADAASPHPLIPADTTIASVIRRWNNR